jgi:hypothetical protein
VRSHQVVLAAGELFDLPDEARLLGRIMDASGRRLIVPRGAHSGVSAVLLRTQALARDAP